MRIRRALFLVVSLSAGYVAVAGCGDDDAAPPAADAGADVASDTSAQDRAPPPVEAAVDARSPEYTGSACVVAQDCYGDFDAASLKGAPYCIDKVSNGYCTHECQTDADCCAVPGECRTTLKQVCAPFENTNKKLCFLSCEDTDIAAGNDAGTTDAGADPQNYCDANVSSEFGCRSTGGGSENRKVCLPNPPGDGGTSDASLLDVALDAPDAG